MSDVVVEVLSGRGFVPEEDLLEQVVDVLAGDVMDDLSDIDEVFDDVESTIEQLVAEGRVVSCTDREGLNGWRLAREA